MKAKDHEKPASRQANDGVTFDTVMESARQTGREARAAAMDQVVHPTVHAVRHAGHQIEQGLHQTMEYMGERLKQLESRAAERPIRVIACAVGAGVLLGLWFRGK